MDEIRKKVMPKSYFFGVIYLYEDHFILAIALSIKSSKSLLK